MANLRLISFKLCPFVQRSVIVLKEKDIPFTIEYIDLANKPDWFLQLSPTGKVPLLQVDGHVLFESAVIMEYLDETNLPTMHPADPFEKAQHRAWIEFGSSLLALQYQMVHATQQKDFDEKFTALHKGLARIEADIVGPWWRGDRFQLIDAAIAPLLTRLDYLSDVLPADLFAAMPKLQAYSQRIVSRASVRESVLPEVRDAYRAGILTPGTWLGSRADLRGPRQ